MAVKITVYGEAKMEQIERARKTLDDLERQAKTSAGGFSGSMLKMSDSLSNAGQKMTNVGDSMTKNVTVPLLAVGAGLYKASEAAADDAQAQVVLANTLKNTTGATDAQVASTEAWITKQGVLLGITDDQLRPALATLVTATKDVGKAQGLAGLAMDVAAAKGVSVEAASKAIAKAYAGQGTALNRLIPGLDQGVLKSGDFAAIQAEVAKVVGGSAAKAADTEAGARQRANVALSEAIENLGMSFLPIMQQVTDLLSTKVVPAITAVSNWFGNLSPGVQNVVLGFGAFLAISGPMLSMFGRAATGLSIITGALGMQTAATEGATAAKWSENAAWLASPTTWIIAGIMALVAAIVLLWKNNEGFRNAVITAWTAIKDTAVTVFNGIKSFISGAFQFLVNLALNWTLAGQIIRHWDAIKNGARVAWDKVTEFFQEAPGRIKDALGDLGGLLVGVGRNLVMGLWNGISNAKDWILDKIRGFGSSVLDSIKGIFGINSPSKETYEIGGYLGQGLALGITNSLAGVVDSAKNLGSAALGAMTGNATGSLTLAGAPGYSGAGFGGTSTSRQIVIQAGAVQVNVGAGASPADTKSAVQTAFDDLVRALGAK